MPHPLFELANEASSPDDIFFGVDIGGAHLKLATLDGHAAALPFPMWTDCSRLGQAIIALRDQLPVQWNENSKLAITMTGEMADCFESRRVGVSFILEAVTKVIPQRQCGVYAVGGRWLTVEEAKKHPWTVASSNWHALAQWCLQQTQWGAAEWSAIVDIGSTTVDIIPIVDRKIASQAKTDRQRMQAGQLVYTGMERTTIPAIVRKLRLDGIACPVMAEKFATISDANLILRSVPEQTDNSDTADGRPRTRRWALARLARVVGEDAESLTEGQLIHMAHQIVDVQAAQVRRCLLRNLPAYSPPLSSEILLNSNDRTVEHAKESEQTRKKFDGQEVSCFQKVFVTGHGRPLIDRLSPHRRLSHIQFDYLDRYVNPDAARCAPALAVAWLYHAACLAFNAERHADELQSDSEFMPQPASPERSE